MKKHFFISGLIIMALCFSGCGNARLDLKVASQPNVNPDNSGRPSPVRVKTYELRNDLAFKQADFQTLLDNPVQSLGADLIATDELVFIPGEARKMSYEPTPETRFIGVVAGFRQMDRARWRVIKAIDPEEDYEIALEFNDTAILVIPDNMAEDWEPEEAVKAFQQQMAQPHQLPGTVQEIKSTTYPGTMVPVQQGGQIQSGGVYTPQSDSATGTSTFRQSVEQGVQEGVQQGVQQSIQQGVNKVMGTSGTGSVSDTTPVRIMRAF
ncbi:type VI secretion system lipoprotein TssJ [Desulfosarcina sp. OttesenSCG-928-G10]|nr:type VI secretion system lipoprotein TssJ [Desulfosarcina sp. OttesenSCG-928-G10]